MENTITIIDATIDRIDQILEIENECFAVPWSKSNFESAFKTDNTRIFALVGSDGSVLAFSCLLIIDYEAEILNIAVRQKQRNKGYAKLLMEHMLDLCAVNDISTVYLEVRESNVPAQSLYKKCGFDTIGIRKRYYSSPVEDAILMAKNN